MKKVRSEERMEKTNKTRPNKQRKTESKQHHLRNAENTNQEPVNKHKTLENKHKTLENKQREPGKIYKEAENKHKEPVNKHKTIENKQREPGKIYKEQENKHHKTIENNYKTQENKHKTLENKQEEPGKIYKEQENKHKTLVNKHKTLENKQQEPGKIYKEQENKHKEPENKQQSSETTHRSTDYTQTEIIITHQVLGNTRELLEPCTDHNHENTNTQQQQHNQEEESTRKHHLYNTLTDLKNKHQTEPRLGNQNRDPPRRTERRNTRTRTEESTTQGSFTHQNKHDAGTPPLSDRTMIKDTRRMTKKERERIDWKFKHDFFRFYNSHLEITGEKSDRVSQKEVCERFNNFCATHGSKITFDSLPNVPRRITRIMSSVGVSLKRISKMGNHYEGIRYRKNNTKRSTNTSKISRSLANPKDAAETLKNVMMQNTLRGTPADRSQESGQESSNAFNKRFPNQQLTHYRIPIPKVTKDSLPIHLPPLHFPHPLLLPQHQEPPSSTENHFPNPPQSTVPSTSQPTSTISYHPIPHLTPLPHHINYPSPTVPSYRSPLPRNILPHHIRTIRSPYPRQSYRPPTSWNLSPQPTKTTNTRRNPNLSSHDTPPALEPQPQTSTTPDVCPSFPNQNQPHFHPSQQPPRNENTPNPTQPHNHTSQPRDPRIQNRFIPNQPHYNNSQQQQQQQPHDPRTADKYTPNQSQMSPQYYIPTSTINPNVYYTLTHLPSLPQPQWLTPLPQGSKSSPLFIPSFSPIPPHLTPIQYINTSPTLHTPLPWQYFTPPQTLFPTNANISFYSPHFPHIPPPFTPLPGPTDRSPPDLLYTPPSVTPDA